MPVTDKEIIERLARLEICVKLKFEELDKAIVLARELAEKERKETKSALEYRLQGMNQFQKRMNSLEATFATIKDLEILREKIQMNSRMIYIGIGIILTIQFLMQFIFKN